MILLTDDDEDYPDGPETVARRMQAAFESGMAGLHSHQAIQVYLQLTHPIIRAVNTIADDHPFWRLPADEHEANVWLALAGEKHPGQRLTADSREPSVGSIVLERFHNGGARPLKRYQDGWRAYGDTYQWADLILGINDYRLIYSPERE